MDNPAYAYGTMGRLTLSKPGGVVTNNRDEVIGNEAVYETMPDNDEAVQNVKDHNETDYDVVL